MDSKSIIVKFHGMEEKADTTELEEYLEALLRHSPSNSTCYMHIFREPKAYLCKLTVHSHVKTFSSQAKTEDMQTAVKNVLREVKSQVASWKKNRTSQELTGVTSVTHLNLEGLNTPFHQEDEQDLLHKKAA